MSTRKRAVVVGASGYTGLEAIEILSRHPHIDLVGLFGSVGGSSVGQRLSDLAPRYSGTALGRLVVEESTPEAVGALEPDAVILATPHEASLELAPMLLDTTNAVVIDISGAFRLRDASLYPRHYGFEHTHPTLLRSAAFGIPELTDGLPGARLVAVAGCYATASMLAIAPLVDSGLVHPSRPVIVDAVSGVSGAGRKPALEHTLCELSLKPYKVLSHRHAPEIAQGSGLSPSQKLLFTPSVAPFDRGIVATVHLDLIADAEAVDVAEAFERAYEGQKFVRVLGENQWPTVAGISRTNFCDIGWCVDPEAGDTPHAVVITALDNLVKGASGQAIQCMNIALDLNETAGLLPAETTKELIGGRL
ncbi:MAG: N-acetyl-gamma-glutamyl-phosphate reductase [Phycisphaerales bacterium JB065]